MSLYNTHTLDNGLRIIQRPSAGDVLYLGYAIGAGSRDEGPDEEGLAHFCEHASFKGTQHRRGWQIIQSLEGVGGELNAYTNKEATVYYCAIMRQHLAKAIDVLTDMVFHSVFPDAELEKEKEVICDEIESYNDSPAELIYDDFDNIIFKGHPLGHNILGTKASVRSFTSADARRFTQRNYRPDNAIFFLYGSLSDNAAKESGDITRLVKMIQRVFQKYPIKPADDIDTSVSTERTSSTSSTTPPEEEDRGVHQAHVLMGRRAYDINHPRRLALYLLNNILGGPAMSSRLNMALREKNGLVYTVESSMTSYKDTGMWCIYFGCDPHDVKRCKRLVRRELDKLMQKPLTERQLQQAKHQIKGQIALACDSRESFALDFAKSFLHYGWEKDVSALCASIDRITADDLQQVAQELFLPDTIQTLEYNP